MLADLHRIELAKLALTHLLETWHMKPDLALADSMLMRSVQIIRAQIWAGPMHHVVLKKALRPLSGWQLQMFQNVEQIK
jgi:hypothetical protein